MNHSPLEWCAGNFDNSARLEVIEDCGHCPQVEAPERLIELLIDFPGRVARAA